MTRSDRPVIVVGGGSHGRVVAAAIRAAGRLVAGIVDPRLPPGTQVDGTPVLGGDEVLPAWRGRATVTVGVGLLPHRRRVFDALVADGHDVTVVVHPSAILVDPVHLSPGAQIMAGVVVQPGTTVGDNVLVNTRASVDHECVLGPHAVVSPGAVLCGNVTIGAEATVGPGATVVRGRQVGAAAEVGAGAVVVRDVPAGTRVLGVPARVVLRGVGGQ